MDFSRDQRINRSVPHISVVIPVRNEERSVSPLRQEIAEALKSLSYEVIFVDDASIDGTLSQLMDLKETRTIRLEKHSGQTAAFSTGFKAARGDIVVTLDGDGQNDPADIPLLLRTLSTNGVDVVAGRRLERADSRVVRMASGCGYLLRRLMFADDVRDSGCSLRVYKAAALEGIELRPGDHRFLPLLLRRRGFTIREIPVRHRPRAYGSSNYTLFKIFPALGDLLRIRFARGYNDKRHL